ncbi:uncharacterized protein M6B38_226040 [Iris pallida]|uniref:Uncharacterized protein n=1 Tax=Iris pallida TaxID=29817 RepID=A0AAX6DVG8_IRIPA|nr:uncharacterized protein M6B38_226040 [Iris pallida]
MAPPSHPHLQKFTTTLCTSSSSSSSVVTQEESGSSSTPLIPAEPQPSQTTTQELTHSSGVARHAGKRKLKKAATVREGYKEG